MMVMGGSSMPKADYDLMAIMYSAYGILYYIILMWNNDIKCKYMFMFPLKYLARKG